MKPCQDLSNAGQRKGFNDTSTRSGMLWEVERILTECKELGELPQILLLENVPQLHSIGENMNNFQKWINRLEELGYKSYWQDLIATDYGIPQIRNRTFMVSILGDYSYTFPKPIPLKLKLKDMLEDNVDEKYYLSDAMLKYMQSESSGGISRKEMFERNFNKKEDVASTITTMAGQRASDNFILTKDTENYIEWEDGKNIQMNCRAWKTNKVVATLNTGGETKILENDTLKKDLCNKLIQDGLVEEGDVVKHSYTSQILNGNKKCVEKNDGNMITLTTRGDCVGVCVGTYQYAKSDTFMNGKDRLQLGKEVSDTLQTTQKEGVVNSDLRIRKLTPRECFRLMGVKDEDFNKVAKNQSNASLYHLAGDSIVTNVISAIFSQLIDN